MVEIEEWQALQPWLTALNAAETWRDPSIRGPRKVSILEPLAILLRSSAPIPSDVRLRLAELFDRHTLKAKGNRVPSYARSESAINAEVLAEFVANYRLVCRGGPITKKEMNDAVKVKQAKATAEGRGHLKLDGMTAAMELREEQRRSYARYYGLNYNQFSNAIDGKHGSINRKRKTLD